MTLDQKIEGVLFYKASPVKKNSLSKQFEVDIETLDKSLLELQNRLSNSALKLVMTDTEVELVTAPDLDPLIEDMRKDELKRDIGKAGAETLAIVLYRGPVTRADIDRIRGVNSAYILRNLMIRGLIEKRTDGRSVSFSITTELLKHLCIKDKTELTSYESVMNALEKYENEQQNVVEEGTQ